MTSKGKSAQIYEALKEQHETSMSFRGFLPTKSSIKVNSGKLTVYVESTYAEEYLSKHFLDDIVNAARPLVDGNVETIIKIDKEYCERNAPLLEEEVSISSQPQSVRSAPRKREPRPEDKIIPYIKRPLQY
jgi:hypothetical protein